MMIMIMIMMMMMMITPVVSRRAVVVLRAMLCMDADSVMPNAAVGDLTRRANSVSLPHPTNSRVVKKNARNSSGATPAPGLVHGPKRCLV